MSAYPEFDDSDCIPRNDQGRAGYRADDPELTAVEDIAEVETPLPSDVMYSTSVSRPSHVRGIMVRRPLRFGNGACPSIDGTVTTLGAVICSIMLPSLLDVV